MGAPTREGRRSALLRSHRRARASTARVLPPLRLPSARSRTVSPDGSNLRGGSVGRSKYRAGDYRGGHTMHGSWTYAGQWLRLAGALALLSGLLAAVTGAEAAKGSVGVIQATQA